MLNRLSEEEVMLEDLSGETFPLRVVPRLKTPWQNRSAVAIVDSVDDFLVRGHQKVIEHYQFLLRSGRLSASERELIKFRLAKAEEDLESFIGAVLTRKIAA